jgi:hypothetical protein
MLKYVKFSRKHDVFKLVGKSTISLFALILVCPCLSLDP